MSNDIEVVRLKIYWVAPIPIADLYLDVTEYFHLHTVDLQLAETTSDLHRVEFPVDVSPSLESGLARLRRPRLELSEQVANLVTAFGSGNNGYAVRFDIYPTDHLCGVSTYCPLCLYISEQIAKAHKAIEQRLSDYGEVISRGGGARRAFDRRRRLSPLLQTSRAVILEQTTSLGQAGGSHRRGDEGPRAG